MCGIAGIFNLDGAPINEAALVSMTSAVAHRGPDGEGIWVSDSIGLGHRRLSILDLTAAGAQPMSTADGRYTISFNGEIYNYLDLRKKLQEKGIKFTTRSDTEVLLESIAFWGVRKAIGLLNGMFAFAIYDKYNDTLILARDRYGIKPLYYCFVRNTVLFGSEIKAIVANTKYHSAIDLEGLIEYLTFQNFFHSKTIFKNVAILPAGCFLSIKGGELGRTPHIERYWDFNFQEPGQIASEADYGDELLFLFEQAVTRQLASDVDIGSYLSGGIDSGSITAVASRAIPSMRTFTCGFDLSSASGIEVSFDERSAAERLSYLFRTEQYEMVLKSGDLERVMPSLAYHLEEPRVGQSYPNFYISRLASKFNKVVLAGTGGDELFGGYPWRYYRAVNNESFEGYIQKYFSFWQRIFSTQELKSVCSPIWSQVSHVAPIEIFRSVFQSHACEMTRPEDYVNHSLYFESKTFLHGLLVVEDKLSMANGLEVRVPFLDNDLVDFAMRLPVSMKLRNLTDVIRLNENFINKKHRHHPAKNKDGKILLRNVMSRILPREIIDREKQGFSAPDASWFKGESIDFVKRQILDPQAKIYKLLDHAAISALLDQHFSGSENRRLMIWSLLNLEALFDRYSLV